MGIFTDLFKSESNSDFQQSYLAKKCSKCGCSLNGGGPAFHQDGKGGWECVAHIELPPKEPTMFDPEKYKEDKERLEIKIANLMYEFEKKWGVEFDAINGLKDKGETKISMVYTAKSLLQWSLYEFTKGSAFSRH